MSFCSLRLEGARRPSEVHPVLTTGSLKACLFASAVALIGFPIPALAQGLDKSTLPSGYYIYLGPQPGQLPPKAFNIDNAEGVIWQNGTPSGVAQTLSPGLDTPGTQTKPSSPGSSVASVPVDSSKQWETCDYPVIKWKPHPISTISGGVAQLSTRFEKSDNQFRPDKLKYNLTLYKISQVPHSTTVQLLDANGFKLIEFYTGGDKFHPVPGTNLVEASEETFIAEKDYRAAQDYKVSSVAPTTYPYSGGRGVFRQF